MTHALKLTHLPPFSGTMMTAAVILMRGLRCIQKIARAFKNRHDAVILARLDDRMLSDIGLTRSDLRDAYAEPLWRDPTSILATRARERRNHRPRGMSELAAPWASPLLVPEKGYTLPKTDRPARYTV